MTTVRWIAVAWLLAFAGGIGVAWFVSGLTTADRDAAARVPEEYANDISAARAQKAPPLADGASRDAEPRTVTVEGVGPGGIQAVTLDADRYDLHVTYEGGGALRVEARSTTGDQRWMLVERAGSWRGTVPFEPPTDGAYDLFVDTAGAWSLKLIATGAPAR